MAIDDEIVAAAALRCAFERLEHFARLDDVVRFHHRREAVKAGIHLIEDTFDAEAGPAILQMHPQSLEALENGYVLRLQLGLRREPELRQPTGQGFGDGLHRCLAAKRRDERRWEPVHHRREGLVADRSQWIERGADPCDEPLVMAGKPDIATVGERGGQHFGARLVIEAALHPDLEILPLQHFHRGDRIARETESEGARGEVALAAELEWTGRPLGSRRLLWRQPPPLEPHLEILDAPTLARIIGQEPAQKLDRSAAHALVAQERVI